MTFIYVGVSLQLFASAIPFIEEGGKNEGWLCWLAGIDRPHLKAAETRVGVSFLSSNGVGLLDRTLMFLPQKCEEGLNERTALFFFAFAFLRRLEWTPHCSFFSFFLFAFLFFFFSLILSKACRIKNSKINKPMPLCLPSSLKAIHSPFFTRRSFWAAFNPNCKIDLSESFCSDSWCSSWAGDNRSLNVYPWSYGFTPISHEVAYVKSSA